MGQTQVVALPGLDSYSEEQLAMVGSISPAFARYKSLIEDPLVPSTHAVRHRAWCECVAATYLQTASTEAICLYWSQVADEVLKKAWQDSGLDVCEAALFALGKHGAEELNLSSDIDLLIVGDPQQNLFIEKGLRRFQHFLQQAGEWGFCFRLDFDLRPGGKMGPMITSPSQFQDYYWGQGETWERLALVRLRFVAGSPSIANPIEDLARRFSFRKFLDYTLLEDLKALRSKIHQTGFERKEGELNLKLEVGGIRDIELFIHALLVLNGGKITDLQTRSTGLAIDRLCQKNLLSQIDANTLKDCYWHYRTVENMVQSINDRQTHSFSTQLPPIPGLPQAKDLEDRRQKVDEIVSGLLGQVNLESVRLPTTEKEQKSWLHELTFSSSSIDEIWEQLAATTALSHKNDRDEKARQEFLYTFIVELAKHQDRDMGLSILLDFVKATRAKASFFSMLLRSPRLIQDLARLFCLSPYLGQILASRPELLDHFILQVDEDWSTDPETLLKQMAERKLLTEIWAANQFLSDRNLDGLYARITSVADEICRKLLRQLKEEFPNATVEILALGKWGGKELGLRSDLDFIFVTPGSPIEDDFKVAKRFISRLTNPMKSGTLYDVDLRLRPSGQSGPLLVEKQKLTSYWQSTAEAWERQAYLRGRVLGDQLSVDKEALLNRPLTNEDLDELKRIRSKLLKPRSNGGIDLKYAPGGILDIEFSAQIQGLIDQLPGIPTSTPAMIDFLAETNSKWKSKAKELKSIYAQLRRIEQALQLSAAYRVSEVQNDNPIFIKCCYLLGMNSATGWDQLEHFLEKSCRILNELDPTDYKSRS